MSALVIGLAVELLSWAAFRSPSSPAAAEQRPAPSLRGDPPPPATNAPTPPPEAPAALPEPLPSPTTPASLPADPTLPPAAPTPPPAARRDINICSAAELRQAAGIGEVLSSRIVAARPFAAATLESQLLTITGIGPTRCASLLERFCVPPPPLRLNTCTAAELMQVPGIATARSARLLAARPYHRDTLEEELLAIRGIGPVLSGRLLAWEAARAA